VVLGFELKASCWLGRYSTTSLILSSNTVSRIFPKSVVGRANMSFFCKCVWDWGLNSGLAKQELYHLNHTSSPSCSDYFEDGISWSICLDWPRTESLLISASQVARITDMSHQCPAIYVLELAILMNLLNYWM
jgi:hypothetical protein